MNNDLKSFLPQKNLFLLFFAIFVLALNGCGGSGGGGDSAGNGGGTIPTYITWSRTYGESDEDAAYSVQQTTDGGYIIAGNSNNEILVIKVDAYGNADWQYKQQGIANSIINSTDGGYIIAGRIGVPLGSAGIIKISSNGKFQWQKTYGNYGSIVNEVRQTWDGRYIIIGEDNKDIIVFKTNSDGDLEWLKYYGGSGEDRGYTIQEVSDGFVIAGEIESSGAGNSDFWILKLDAKGEMLWQKTYGGNQYDIARSIRQTSDGGYVVVGETSSYGSGNSDIWVLKLDKYGNKEWDKAFGGVEREAAYSVQLTSDGGYIIAGETSSYGAGGSDIWILKLDTNGNKLWDKTHGTAGNDIARSIQQTSDGGYIVAGETTTDAGDTDFWVLKLDANGNLN